MSHDYAALAWAQVPRLAPTEKAAQAAWRVTVPAPHDDLARVQRRVRDRLLAGEPVGDLLTEVTAARTTLEDTQLAQRILNEVATGLRAEATQLRAAGAEVALQWLATQLTEQLDRVAEVDLGGVRSADEAVAAGGEVLTAWTPVQSAAAEVDAIRRAQIDITLVAATGAGVPVQRVHDDLPRYGIVAAAATRVPLLVESTDPRAQRASDPWPSGLGQVLGQLDGTFDLWCPTLSELIAVADDHHRAAALCRRSEWQKENDHRRGGAERVDRDLQILAANHDLNAQRDTAATITGPTRY